MFIGVPAIFGGGGAGSILPEKYGTAPEKWTSELTWLNRTRQESLTTSIVENRWRTHIYIYIVLSSSIFVKHALNSHFVKYTLPEKLLDCQKKIILPDSGGLQPPSSHAYGYVMASVWLGTLVMRRNWCLRVWSLVSLPVCCESSAISANPFLSVLCYSVAAWGRKMSIKCIITPSFFQFSRL